MASEWHWDTHTTPHDEGYDLSVSYDSGGSVTPTEQPPEFDRFAELTTKLVAVPKSEIDAERKKH
jgi:hypothetical protein